MSNYEMLHDELVEVISRLRITGEKSLQLMFLFELREINRNLSNLELTMRDRR